MRLRSAAFALLTLVGAPALAQPAPAASSTPRAWQRYADAREVQLRDVAGYVRITPEDRRDVAISITNPGALPGADIGLNGGRLVINGQLRRQVRSCLVGDNNAFEVSTRRHGVVANAQLPTYEVRVPRNAIVAANGAVRLHVGASESLRLRFDGCGDADVERVTGEADVAVSGAPDLRVYDAGTADIAVAGAGDVVFGVVRDGLTVSIAGSGDFLAARADGPTNIAIQGSGDVTIRGGRANPLSVAIAGSGDVTHTGAATQLDAVVLGSGDVRVRQVDGDVRRRVLGSGEVVVGR